MILYKFGFSAFELFHCFLGTVLAYTSTAVPSIKHDNSTFVDQNENLMAFICKYSQNVKVCLLPMTYILFYLFNVFSAMYLLMHQMKIWAKILIAKNYSIIDQVLWNIIENKLCLLYEEN